MPGLRDLKRRIKSIQSTRKVTRAMQLVSAAKMRKAQDAVVKSRTYASLAWDLITSLGPGVNFDHPLLAIYPDAEKTAVLVLGTNRTLVGGLNTNLGRKLLDVRQQARSVDAVVYGKQAARVTTRVGQTIVADFPKEERTITSEDIYTLARYVTDAYITGEYKAVYIVYNHFVSTLVQRPTVRQLLPFMPYKNNHQSEEEKQPEYLFEPSPNQVLEHLLPRILESQIYQLVLESNASEHSARMVMMKNATEAAGDLISDLTLTYNKLRQNKITTELAEITAGKIALE